MEPLIPKDENPKSWVDRSYEPTKSEQNGLRPKSDLFFRNGEHLTMLERAGFLSLSLPIFGFGVGLLVLTMKLFRELNPAMIVSGVIGTAFTYGGYLGIRNALRFKRNASHTRKSLDRKD